MHVCHFCDTTLEGDYFRNIVSGLTGKGVRVSLIELGRGEPPTWVKDFPDVSYLNLSSLRRSQYPAALWRLSRYLKDQNVDILHTHLFNCGLLGVLTKRFHRKTVVGLMRHHTSVVRLLGTRFHVAADRWMAENADRVVTVSDAAKRYMVEVDKVRRDDIEVIHLGFDFGKFSPNAVERSRIRREFDFSEDDFVIGYVANLIPGKGHVQLLAAFEIIAAELPKARLFLPGGGEPDNANIEATGVSSDRIVLAGWRPDIFSCLNAMDIFVQPSLSEAFSQVIVEAMGVGLPVVATDVGGASEVIESGVNGVLIEPDDPAAIADQVIRLYRDHELRHRYARAGRSTVTEKFTAERMVERHFSLYEKWLA